MEFFFNPRGIAVIGATANELKGGATIVKNIRKGFKGGIYPVNPNYKEIQGLACYDSILDVPDPVDIAIVFVPAGFVPGVLRDCARRGLKGVMIESGGFAETGGRGKALQDEIRSIGKETGLRLWGPNCMGLVDAVNRNVFSFVSPTIWDEGLPAEPVSLIVQSGMLSGAFLIDLISHGTMGVGKVCSIGNKVDVNECDLLEYFIDDPDTGAVGLYLEAIPEGRRFIDICRRSSKPITVLKGGKSEGGARAAMSHTASMAGNGALISGVLAQAGVIEAKDFKQMMDVCRSLAAFPDYKLGRKGRAAILTYSGGAGIVSTDFMEELNVDVAELSPVTYKQLKTVFPDWMPPANPVDLWPAVEKNGSEKAYGVAAKAVLADPNVDAVLVHLFTGGFFLQPDISALAREAKAAGKPMFAWVLGSRDKVREIRIEARKLRVQVFSELYRSVECMAAVMNRSEIHRDEQAENSEAVVLSEGARAILSRKSAALDECDSKKILAEVGIPVVDERIAANLDEAEAAAEGFGYPVVLKGMAPGKVHKTEAGLVRLNIIGGGELEAAFNELKKAVGDGGEVLIQKQIKGELELIAGLVRDRQFGSCVMCGLGGVLAEAIGEAEFCTAPLGMRDAMDMIDRLKAQALLNGYRGAAPVNRERLADIIVKLGALGASEERIEQVDINPLIICDGEPVAVDASIILE